VSRRNESVLFGVDALLGIFLKKFDFKIFALNFEHNL
jgi:hypothetical protein